jgi:hypothetical protein
MYWCAVIAISVYVLAFPPIATKAQSPKFMDMLYMLLLSLSVADLLLMKFFIRRMMRPFSCPDSEQPAYRPTSVPMILAALGAGIMIYSLLYRILGGSVAKSMSFVVFALLAYVIFEMWAPLFGQQLGNGSEE